MKRAISIFLISGLILSLSACGQQQSTSASSAQEETSSAVIRSDTSASISASASEPEEELVVMETDSVHIDGVCVNDGYLDDDGSSIRTVYLFYSVTANDTNLKLDSKGTVMTINGSNSYTSEHSAPESKGNFTPDYYLSEVLTDVYVGESKKFVTVFKIPEGDLASGRSVTLSDSSIKDMEQLSFSTDDMQHFSTADELYQKMDPEGYADEIYRREPADEVTAETVINLVDGYYWKWWLSSSSFELEFIDDTQYELRSSIVGVQHVTYGTYSVANGYIILQNDENGSISYIAYELTDGDIDLDTTHML